MQRRSNALALAPVCVAGTAVVAVVIVPAVVLLLLSRTGSLGLALRDLQAGTSTGTLSACATDRHRGNKRATITGVGGLC